MARQPSLRRAGARLDLVVAGATVAREVHAIDAAAITDAQAEAVKQYFGDEGLVALLQALGVFDGMIRLGLLWGLADSSGDRH